MTGIVIGAGLPLLNLVAIICLRYWEGRKYKSMAWRLANQERRLVELTSKVVRRW